MRNLESFLQQLLYGNPNLGLPTILTIARSTEDGFTTSTKADDLQRQVLNIVSKVFSSYDSSGIDDDLTAIHQCDNEEEEKDKEEDKEEGEDLIRIHDLRENAIEKAFSLFLFQNGRQGDTDTDAQKTKRRRIIEQYL